MSAGREGPYGPPTIRREPYVEPYSSGSYPPLYSAGPPSRGSYGSPPSRSHSYRAAPPPSRDYYSNFGPPPPRSTLPPRYYHEPTALVAPTTPPQAWRSDEYFSHRYHGPLPPPPHSYSPRDMPPPEAKHPDYSPPRADHPPPHFRPQPKFVTPSMKREAPPLSPSRGPPAAKKKKADSLSLLAKVSTAMSEEEGEEIPSVPKSPHSTQHAPPSPVTMWTPTSSNYEPYPQRSAAYHHLHPSYSWRAPPSQYYQHHHDPYGPPPYYRPGTDSPPAVISERGSFESEPSPSRPRMEYAPYTYVQLPRQENKTVLRKKFSWKHYPELERFLIANRDDYLRHSALNYTAQQKQYNNWLTKRLLEVAARHHYVFDPEEFNFVAVRDRIRCYYKSYVQTARKRGLDVRKKRSEVEVNQATQADAVKTEEEDKSATATAAGE